MVTATLGSRTGRAYVLAVQLNLQLSVSMLFVFLGEQTPETYQYSKLLHEAVAAELRGSLYTSYFNVFLPDVRRNKKLPVGVSIPPKADIS